MGTIPYPASHSLRRLRNSPGFTTAAVLTLALCIGANTLIFSVLNVIFLRPLAYGNPERLVWATEFFPKFNRSMVLAPEYAAWKRENSVFDSIEAMGFTFGATFKAGSRPAQHLLTAHVTPGFFRMVGIAPRLGAGFENTGGAVIISDSLWRSYLESDPNIVGKTIALNSKQLTIGGVMPSGFVYPDGADVAVWLPDAVPAEAVVPSRSPRAVRVIGSLKPGVTLEQGRDQLERIARSLDSQYPIPWGIYHAAAKVQVISLQKQLSSDSKTAVVLLMGAVGILLFIACANVANLYLARALTQRKEVATRFALGATRLDIVRMLLSESLLLGAMGGVLGLVILLGGRRTIEFLLPKALAQGIPIDWRVLAFTAACSVAAALLFGLAPALVASITDVNSVLKRTATASSEGLLPGFLAAAQIALSVVLLAGAGLMVRSLLVLSSTNPGFDPSNVFTSTVMLQPFESYGPERQLEFFGRMLAEVEILPGVRAAALTNSPPMAQFDAIEAGLRADGGPETKDTVAIVSVSPKYFQTLGIRLIAGRVFDARDNRDGVRVVIANETLARVLFHGNNPLGHRINSSEVVGVVADIRHRALDDAVWPELFVPYEQSPSPLTTLLVRAPGNPTALAGAVRRIARSIDPAQPIFDAGLLEARILDSLAQRRDRARILAAFAALALLIAVIGIYAVVSYSVAHRTQELGLRVALGAQPSQIIRMVLASGMRVSVFGATVGLAAALLVGRLLRTFLYGISPSDMPSYLLACGVMIAASFLASYLPARRASAADPIAALRQE
jgi:putative ABC transport system permease protein